MPNKSASYTWCKKKKFMKIANIKDYPDAGLDKGGSDFMAAKTLVNFFVWGYMTKIFHRDSVTAEFDLIICLMLHVLLWTKRCCQCVQTVSHASIYLVDILNMLLCKHKRYSCFQYIFPSCTGYDFILFFRIFPENYGP